MMDFRDDDCKPQEPAWDASGGSRGDACERHVDASEFLALAVSGRKLWRYDDTTNDRRGLMDPHTGERIVTPRVQLARLVSGRAT